MAKKLKAKRVKKKSPGRKPGRKAKGTLKRKSSIFGIPLNLNLNDIFGSKRKKKRS